MICDMFEKKIQNWKPTIYPRRLRKNYIFEVSYLIFLLFFSNIYNLIYIITSGRHIFVSI